MQQVERGRGWQLSYAPLQNTAAHFDKGGKQKMLLIFSI